MDWDRKTMRQWMLLIGFGVLLYWALQNVDVVQNLLKTGVGLLAPFLLGLSMAFIVNVPMRALEERLFGALPDGRGRGWRILQRAKRPLCLVLAFLLILAVILVVVLVVVPEFSDTVDTIRRGFPGFVAWAQGWLTQLEQRLPELDVWIQGLSMDWESIGKSLFSYLRTGAGSLFNSTFSFASTVFSGVFNFVMGLAFCVYTLLQKEKLAGQMKKLLYGWLPLERADRIVEVGRLSGRVFSSFITGQCLEAVILGFMFLVAMLLLGFPYALMISVLVGFTALIPVFGAFIGCAVGAFMILIEDPGRVIWFVILFLVLQQIEGNLIYPKVVGTSVGLPAIWVLLAVTLGGSAFGVLGMLVFVPLTSVLYALLRQSTQRRLAQRKIPPRRLR